ncbi:MAG: HAD-IA family hydrolase [Bacteroidetes bacterium]|jgi:phosphonatase-like hydrolase|nr:HAD-IA family hydrolase [Bacteroidota bacterium]
MIQLVIFDMAGTVFNEDNIVYKTIHEICLDGGIEVSLDRVLESAGGKEKRSAIRDLLIENTGEAPSETLLNSMYGEFLDRLKQNYEENEIRLFPSVRPCMDWLRKQGISIALSTGYVRPVAEQLVDMVDLKAGKDFDLLVTAEDVANGRPQPDMIELICNRIGIPPHRTLKIGDTQIDIQEGKNAGVAISAGVTTGAHSRAFLSKVLPDAVLDSLSELPELIKHVSAEEE